MITKIQNRILCYYAYLIYYLYKLNKTNKIFTHLTMFEKVRLFLLASSKNGNFVEIGSYLGASSYIIAMAAKNNKSKLYCIDTCGNDAMSEGKKNTYQTFMYNIKDYADKIIPIRGYSYKEICYFKDNDIKIDFHFIDSDHSYKGVKTDWDLYSPLLNKNSIVIFHDFGWADGVKQVIKEDVKPLIKKDGRLSNMYWAWIK